MSVRNKYTAVFSIALILGAVGASALVAGCGTPTPVVKDVDHIAISSSEPEQLFTFLTGTLGLPAAWPFVQYPGFATGGVHMGNVNVETLELEGAGAGKAYAAIYGIVFDPYPLAESVPLLKERGAKPGKPTVQTREENGKQVPIWTNVNLDALSSKEYIVYLCQYTAQSKAHLDAATATSKPPFGPLGVTSVRESVISSTDPEATTSTWEKTLTPTATNTDGGMEFGSGPAVRIEKGSVNAIASLVIEVASLAKAKEFLQKNKLLGASSATDLTIEPSVVQGLDIRLVQQVSKQTTE